MIIPPPPGSAYHHLASASPRRWWLRLIVAVVGVLAAICAMTMVAVSTFVVGAVVGRPTGPDGVPTFGDVGDLAWQLIAIAMFTPAVLLAAVLLQRRPAGTVSSVSGHLRLRWLGACLLVGVALTAASFAVIVALTAVTSPNPVADELGWTKWVGWWGFSTAVAVLLPLVPMQAAAEEYLFRGWLLQAMGGFAGGRWIGMAVSAVAFAFAHGLGTVWGFLDLVAFGVVAAWLTIRTGGLEAAIGLHVAGNLFALGWAAAVGALASPETAADSSLLMVAVDVPMLVLYAVVVTRLTRRRPIAFTVPVPPVPVPPPIHLQPGYLPSGIVVDPPAGAADPAGAATGGPAPVSGPGRTPR